MSKEELPVAAVERRVSGGVREDGRVFLLVEAFEDPGVR